MARLRRPPYLVCFYCSKRTSMRNDGQVRHFECPRCEATNYLDENGDITDPPIATTAASDDVWSSSFSSLPHDGISSSTGGSAHDGDSTTFCPTCLKNQHLFISSLAQYFPADPNHPDTPELERQYFRFRQRLEQRYPQVCADCEPKVLERIQAAGYTAKTDHLRRMVDYSRQVRQTRTSSLDAAYAIGHWLWWSGLILQLLWQTGVLGGRFLMASDDKPGFNNDVVVDQPDAPRDVLVFASVDLPAVVVSVLRILTARADWLQALCIGTTYTSVWWNPYFVQTVRGFTKPLVGISAWYAHQAAIVVVRLVLFRFPAAQPGPADGASQGLPPTMVGVHAVAALFMLYLYVRAPRSIRKDLRPLFAKQPVAPLTPQRTPATALSTEQFEASRRRRAAGLETMSDVLDEISTSPARPDFPSPIHSLQQNGTAGGRWDRRQPPGRTVLSGLNDENGPWTPPATRTQLNNYGYSSRQGKGSDLTFGALQNSQQDNRMAGATDHWDTDAMDWTPTQGVSAPQDFSSQFTTSPSPSRGFNTLRVHDTYDRAGAGPSVSSPNGQKMTSAAPSVCAFSQTPVTDDRGPFWYKVPPAPTSMAQRIFNSRPGAPQLVQHQAIDGSSALTQTPFQIGQGAGKNLHQLRSSYSGNDDGASSSVEFAQPSFFAEDLQRKTKQDGGEDDPDNILSDLFSQTFSLKQDGDEDSRRAADGSDPKRGWRRGPGSSATASTGGASTPLGRHALRLLLLLASSGVVYTLRTTGLATVMAAFDDDTNPGLRGLATSLSPRTIETVAVGVCAFVAATLGRESARRWTAAVVGRQRQQRTQLIGGTAATDTAFLPLLGVLLGLASLAQATWMAMQLYAAVKTLGGPGRAASSPMMDVDGFTFSVDEGVTAAVAPATWPGWSDWRLAGLHATVLAHEVWNLCT